MRGAIASVEIFAFAPAGPAVAAAAAGDAPDPAAPARAPATATASAAADAPDPAAPADAPAPRPRRLSLVIGVPERAQADGLWHCRVALADLHRPRTLAGRDSFEALCLAVECARGWLAALDAEGFALFRDRAGAEPFAIP